MTRLPTQRRSLSPTVGCLLLALLGCLPAELDTQSGLPLPDWRDWQVVPPPCEVMAGWNQPAELVTALALTRLDREEGLEEYVRIEPDGAYELTIARDGEVVEQHSGTLTPESVAELAGLLHDWETDAGGISPQECPVSFGRYEITYAGRTCGWPVACAVVPRPLKCVALRIIESTPLDRGSIRLEFLDR